MDCLPPQSSYRLSLLLSRERLLIEDGMIRGARLLSPHYAAMPDFLLRQWCHEITRAVITTLVDADLQHVHSYGVSAALFARRVGRSHELVRGLIGTWGSTVRSLVDSEFDADPALYFDMTAILQTLLDLADQAVTEAYAADLVEHPALHSE
jgi:hypothetical protein